MWILWTALQCTSLRIVGFHVLILVFFLINLFILFLCFVVIILSAVRRTSHLIDVSLLEYR